MTLEFAKREAQRRTSELRRVHYVVRPSSTNRMTSIPDADYLVVTVIPHRYTSVISYAYRTPAVTA